MPRKKLTSKDWYWEAEQDKIAADEDFKLLPSPDGWPGEGLECLGLWLLIFNQMARSRRKGYLCDPVDENKPMSMADLSRITSRTRETVLLVLNVLLDRNLFSKNEQGIIYSRGLVRKEELRVIRSKSGKKGGLRAQRLLKQKLEQSTEQNVEQTLRIGIRIDSPDSTLNDSADFLLPKFDDASHRLAFLYRSTLKGRRAEDETICVQAFAEMLAMGATEEVLAADLRRKPPERDRSEHLWQIKKRLLETAPKKANLTEAAKANFAWAEEEEAKYGSQ